MDETEPSGDACVDCLTEPEDTCGECGECACWCECDDEEDQEK